ncbi:MAG: bifunctional 4-hydroxy-2-oxoglutarate aldolase/2-dehydro-3-deoxy-phosphogluconate aldolase [Desulfobacterales bacterium]|nr:bifunctional 4-hydroxy-2-oxoglutarate aldolase/2-dehydro-3-deoxy-phosphogluconate aldolase [Desulfobacterales bacterium]
MSAKRIIMDQVFQSGLIPVIRTNDKNRAMAIAEAVFNGGLPTIELTMVVPGVLDAIKELNNLFGDKAVIGVGTVLDAETARMAILAGAQFIVAPTIDSETVKVCHRYAKPVIPGAMTPTEILKAWECGSDVVKLFPADLIGGPEFIKAVKGPLDAVELMPSGGVTMETAEGYIKAGARVLSVGGGLVSKKIMESKDYKGLTQKTELFLSLIRSVREKINANQNNLKEE